MQAIRPCLWCIDNAEEVADLYTSIFKNSRVLERSSYGKGAPLPEGTLLTATIELQGQEFMLLNGGPNPNASFSDGISFAVSVDTQEEVDHLWDRLTADGGEPGRCGWLKDKFGVSWQIVPKALVEVLSDEDSEKSSRAMQAMMAMGKLDIAELRRAHAGAEARLPLQSAP
jgi:predicted 3-demethylubiquinone-9 3-methyltransferase (glyoxalase superfamily)